MEKYLLAIDLGTTSCKTVLFNEELQIVASSNKSYTTSYPEVGWAEQTADIWWEAMKTGIQEVLSTSRIEPDSIAGIGIDAMGSVMLPVDSSGKALRPGLLWMDRRSEAQSLCTYKKLKESLARINGNHNDPSNIAPKILWFKECEPELYRQTSTFLHANGYLVMKLTGVASMDHTEGGLTQLVDTRTGKWSDELIEKYGIDRSKLPPIFHSTDVVGVVTKEAELQTGLSAGTKVVAGSMDMVAAALGSGSIRNGDLYVSGGTVTAVGLCLDRPLYHPNLHIYHHVVPGLWLSAAGVDYGGAGVKWFKELLELEDYSTLDAIVETGNVPSQPLLFLPYMVGQRAPLWNSHTRGVIAGIHPSCGRKDLARAMMEGNALGVRRLLDIYRESGLPVKRLKLTGGCANSIPWSQIITDICGLNVSIPGQMDVAALGSAINAAVGIGLFNDFSSVEELILLRKQYEPNPVMTRYYDRLYQIFIELYQGTLSIYDKLKELSDDLSGTCADGS